MSLRILSFRQESKSLDSRSRYQVLRLSGCLRTGQGPLTSVSQVSLCTFRDLLSSPMLLLLRLRCVQCPWYRQISSFINTVNNFIWNKFPPYSTIYMQGRVTLKCCIFFLSWRGRSCIDDPFFFFPSICYWFILNRVLRSEEVVYFFS